MLATWTLLGKAGKLAAQKVPPTWSPEANPSKTERIAIKVAEDKHSRGAEPWRSSKALGPLLGEGQDVARRMQLATAATANLRNFLGGGAQ